MKPILLLTLLLSSVLSDAQNSFTISGIIVDKAKNPLVSANVILLKDSNTLFTAQYSLQDGTFNMSDIVAGTYHLKVMLSGFETYQLKDINVIENILLPSIELKEKSNELKEVSVRVQKPFIEVKADKIVVNVENSIVNAGLSVMDVLQKSPGVRVDQNENISLKGKPGIAIWIDGKPTSMVGSDLANLLRSMPANSVDKIELISSPSARYDAAGTGGIINIKTKKDQRIGWNGTLNANYGQGVYSKYGFGGTLNHRHKKFNVYANYTYSNKYWFNHLMLNRKFLDTSRLNFDQQLYRYDQENNALFDFKNHIASFGADYRASAKTTLGASLSYISNSYQPTTDNKSQAYGPNEELLYHFNTSGNHKNFVYNLAANTYLRYSFDSTGKELSFDIDYARFGNQNNQNFITTYQYINPNQSQPDYFLKSNLNGLTQIRSFKADYTTQLRNNLKYDMGVKTSFVTADNESIFHVKTTGDFIVDSSRTNHFIYYENINAAYINLNKDGNKWSSQLGLRLENTNINFQQTASIQKFDTNFSYTQLFPSLAWQYHLSSVHDIGIAFSRRIERPTYQQLNPFKFFVDKTTYKEGYARLQPASFYSVELSHTFKQKFVSSFTYGINKGIITQVIQPSETEDSVTVQTDKNLDQMIFIGISGAYPFTIAKWWNNVTNFNIYYAKYQGNIANTPLNNGGPTFDFSTTNSFLLPKGFSAELGGYYQARQVYGYMNVNPNWMLNFGIQKLFLDKRATLKFNFQDIFWSGYPSASSRYIGYTEYFIAQRETRVATISFTYRFGKRTVPPSRNHRGGAEDEKKRATSSGA